jgi:hypothetical protein
MMAQIKHLEGIDGDDPAEYQSSNPDRDAYTLRMIVGPLDAAGEESFDVTVCTPLWLADEVDRHGPQLGRHFLIVAQLNLPKAISFLRERIEHRLSGDNWTDLASKIARIGYWEFEDYRP